MLGKLIFCAVLCLSLNQGSLARPWDDSDKQIVVRQTPGPIVVRTTAGPLVVRTTAGPLVVRTTAGPLVVRPTPTAEPVEPVEPSKPEEPVEPSKPVEPEEPVQPSQPEEPVEPSKPVEPEEPIEPSKPVEPVEPTKPEEPKAVSDCKENLKQLRTTFSKFFSLLYKAVNELFQGLFRTVKCITGKNIAECAKESINTISQNLKDIFADFAETIRNFGKLFVSTIKTCTGRQQLAFVEPFVYGFNLNF